MAVALGAWILHVGALALAPLSVVQAVLSTGVVILAVLAERLFGFDVGPRQWLGVAMTAGGLVLLVVTLPTHDGAQSAYSLAGMISFETGMLVIGALLICGKHLGAPDHHHGIMLGAAAGTLFGVSDVAIKALTGLAASGVIVSPWLAVAVVASVVAFYASARGLQDGEAVPVIAATSTAANVSCILGGIVVFGDPMPGDTLGIDPPGRRLHAGRASRAGARRRRCARPPPTRPPELPARLRWWAPSVACFSRTGAGDGGRYGVSRARGTGLSCQARAYVNGSASAISRSRGAVASRSENCRSASGTGHSIPTSGSSNAIPRSVSPA